MLKKSSSQIFDAIVVGSSPILLFEALYLSRQGCKVGIFEEKPHLGGAWYTKSIWHLNDVEVACHYIERGKNNYHFLKTSLHVDLQYLPAHILWVTNKDEIFRWRKCHRTLKQAISNLAPSVLLVLFGNKLISKRIWNAVARLKDKTGDPLSTTNLERSHRHLYPTGGCKTIVNTLLSKIEQESIRTFTNSHVNLVDVDEARSYNVCWIGNQSYKARRIVTGQFVDFDVSVNGTPIIINKTSRHNTHVVLRIRGKKKRSFSYIDIRNSVLLKRISDIGAYSGYEGMLDHSELLLSCHVRPEIFDQMKTPADIFSYLIEINLLKKDASLLDYHVEHYNSPGYVGSRELRRLEACLPNSLEIMRTWDLGKGIEHYYPRWSSMFGTQ